MIKLYRQAKEEHLDVCYGIRSKRDAPFYLKVAYKLYYKIIEGLAPAYRQSGRGGAAWSVLEDYLDLCQACGYAEGLVGGYTLMGRYEFLNPDLASVMAGRSIR